jgi:hypothetical protein
MIDIARKNNVAMFERKENTTEDKMLKALEAHFQLVQ